MRLRAMPGAAFFIKRGSLLAGETDDVVATMLNTGDSWKSHGIVHGTFDYDDRVRAACSGQRLDSHRVRPRRDQVQDVVDAKGDTTEGFDHRLLLEDRPRCKERERNRLRLRRRV